MEKGERAVTILTRFSLGERVLIKELNRPGMVVALYQGDIGLQYSVRYFDGATPQTVYFFEAELDIWQGYQN